MTNDNKTKQKQKYARHRCDRPAGIQRRVSSRQYLQTSLEKFHMFISSKLIVSRHICLLV